MIVAVPALNGVTTPVDDPTVATVASLLDHVPPDVLHVRVDVAPLAHRERVPVMAAGLLFTVTVVFL